MRALEEAYRGLRASKVFKKEGFLCSVFMMAGPKELEAQPWQFDFYNKQKDAITSYVVDEEVRVVNVDTEMFRKEKRSVEELVLAEVKVDFASAITILKQRVKKRHESATKFIIVLQKEKVPLWNMSVLTDAFNLVNVKVDAQTKKVVDEKVFPMLSWS